MAWWPALRHIDQRGVAPGTGVVAALGVDPQPDARQARQAGNNPAGFLARASRRPDARRDVRAALDVEERARLRLAHPVRASFLVAGRGLAVGDLNHRARRGL